MFVSTLTAHCLVTSIRYKFSYRLLITPKIRSVDKHTHYQYEGGPNLHNNDDDDDNDDDDYSAPLTMYSLCKKLENFRRLKYFWFFRISKDYIGTLVKLVAKVTW